MTKAGTIRAQFSMWNAHIWKSPAILRTNRRIHEQSVAYLLHKDVQRRGNLHVVLEQSKMENNEVKTLLYPF